MRGRAGLGGLSWMLERLVVRLGEGRRERMVRGGWGRSSSSNRGEEQMVLQVAEEEVQRGTTLPLTSTSKTMQRRIVVA